MKIAIAGRIRSGKDTVGDLLKEKHILKPFAFADGIAEIIKNYFPEAFENGKPRRHYQHIGQELRELNPYVWINYLDRQIKQSGLQDILVTDCRQNNESTYLRENGFMVVKVQADIEVRKQRILLSGDISTPEQLEHDTEKQVESLIADYVIENNGTLAELEGEVIKMVVYYNNYFEPKQRYKEKLRIRWDGLDR